MLKNYTKVVITTDGSKYYLNDKGQKNRLDGPAVEYQNGVRIWCVNGKTHRNIEMAIKFDDINKIWWFKGKKHRIGGISFGFWNIHDVEYTKEDYYNIVWNI